MSIKVFTYHANTPNKIVGEVGKFDDRIIDGYTDWFSDNLGFEPTDNVQEVLAQDIKIACVPVYFDRIVPQSFDFTQFDLLLFSEPDHASIDAVNAWIEEKNIAWYCKYLIMLGSWEVGNFKNLTVPSNVVLRPYYAYQLLDKFDPADNNPTEPLYNFEALLGSRKDHRDFVMAKMQTSGLLEQSLVTYRRNFSNVDFVRDHARQYITQEVLQGQDLNYPYVSPLIGDTDQDAVAQGATIMPWSVLNHARYSIITESYPEGAVILSEKTGKAILAKKLFVMFGARYALHYLREFYGFKTFSGIINESYDDIRDNFERWSAAWEQVEWLAKQDPNKVAKLTAPIIEHNYNRFFELKAERSTQAFNLIQEQVSLC